MSVGPEVLRDEDGFYVEPVCPECGAHGLIRYAVRHVLVYERVESVYTDMSVTVSEMEDVPEDDGGWEDVTEDRDRPDVFCLACAARFPDEDVYYDQLPETGLG